MDEQRPTGDLAQQNQNYSGSPGTRTEDYATQAGSNADGFLYTLPYGEVPEISLSALRAEDYKKLTGVDKPGSMAGQNQPNLS